MEIVRRWLVTSIWWPASAAVLLFLALGSLLIPYPGLQEDELIFATPIYQPAYSMYHVSIAGIDVPVMLQTYLGATKSWIYAAIFRWWEPSLYSVRVPLLLLYACTIWILFMALTSVHSWRAGVVGALLLASDPTYVLTGCFAWCSLQNVLMLIAFGLALRFHSGGNRIVLAGAAFCTGLWLWDKALSLWLLTGILAGLAIVFPRESLRYLRPRILAVALPAFCAGALPLIAYNVTHDFATFRSNAHFSTAHFVYKLDVLRGTGDGSAWLGYLVNGPAAPNPRAAQTRLERWSVSLHDLAGEHPRDYLPYAFLAALVLLPALAFKRRVPAIRLSILCLIAISVAWAQMAFTEGAGGGGHHPALLWPIPHLLIAIALAEASFRYRAIGSCLLAAVMVVLISSNVLTVNQYLYQFVRFGAAGSWSDAMFPLSNGISKQSASTIFVADWGILNGLTTLHQGRLPLRAAIDLFQTPTPSEAQKKEALAMFAEKDAVWLAYTPGNEMLAGINAHRQKMAAEAGYRTVILATFNDSNGRPILEAFRFERR